MNTFKINKNNLVYKNYIIRTYSGSINICTYENLIQELASNLKREIYNSDCVCTGNWIEGVWWSGGINAGDYPDKIIKKSKSIETYKNLIDKIATYDEVAFDNLWFFVCLSYLTQANIKLADISDNDYSTSIMAKELDMPIIKDMLKLNKLSLKDLLIDGLNRNYFVTDLSIEELCEVDKILINKKELLLPFLNKLISMQASFNKYEDEVIKNKNKEFYPLDIQEEKLFCFKNKIMTEDKCLTYIEDLNSDIIPQLLKNKTPGHIDNLPETKLTGQLVSFYLNHIIKMGDIKKIKEKNVPPDIYRELKKKNYMENYVSYDNGVCWKTFEDIFIKDINEINTQSSISNNNLEERKSSHTAVEYVKNIAKQLKNKDKSNSLMKIQEKLVQEFFNLSNISQLYEKIKEDILVASVNNREYIYEEAKKEEFICFGKNHIGYYAHKPSDKILYHMAFIENSKLIESIKSRYKVVDLTQYNQFIPDKEITFILVEGWMIDKQSIEFIKQIVRQGRSYNKFLLFNFSSILDAQEFFNDPCMIANTYKMSYSREIYESLYGKMNDLKIAVNKVTQSPNQTEYFV
jgi:hypothetical protein